MNTQGALELVIRTLLELATFLMLTRFLLQLVKADFYNPICQTIVRLTNPLLMPLRKILPSHKQFDFAALIMVVVLIVAKLFFLAWLQGFTLNNQVLAILGVKSLASLLLNYIFWAVLISVLMSWVLPDPRHPFVQFMTQLTEPVMAPARRLLPPMGGLDLSPIIVLFAIQIIQVLFNV